MATCQQSADEGSTASESAGSDQSCDSDTDSSVDTTCQGTPCKFYNRGGCRDGDRCLYLHMCRYALKGNCRNGSRCKLKHPRAGSASSPTSNWESNPSAEAKPTLTDGRLYQWQLNDGSGWKDVDNDHILEAQYCLPHTKSIKLYNTPYGAISVDFKRLRVYQKKVGVRRLDDGKTQWIWYCSLRRKWRKYDDTGSKGNPSPVKSADIEKKFQSNPSGSFAFNIGNDTFDIKFPEMRQVGQKRKRRVSRRPVYQHQAGTAPSQATSALQRLSLGPKWEFKGKHGWHEFKQSNTAGCSVTSDDIERGYQQNHSGSMNFQVGGKPYKLDFAAMTQTNLSSNKSRRIRRV